MYIILQKSTNPTKKWMVTFPNGKKVHFGATGYEDYTQHHDPERMHKYITRHQKNEHWHDMYTAGFWSRWLLWSEPSMSRAIKHVERLTGYKIIKR